MPRIGELLRDRRCALGLSKSEVARRLGVTPSAVSRWEAGEREADAETADRWARHLGAAIEVRLIVLDDTVELPDPRRDQHLRSLWSTLLSMTSTELATAAAVIGAIVKAAGRDAGLS